MIRFMFIAKEGMMLLVWTRIPVATDYDPKPKKKKQKTGLPKEEDDVFDHYFLRKGNSSVYSRECCPFRRFLLWAK